MSVFLLEYCKIFTDDVMGVFAVLSVLYSDWWYDGEGRARMV